MALVVKNPPFNAGDTYETWVRSLGQKDPLEKAQPLTPVCFPGESPWTEEPGGLQSMGRRVGH